MQLRHWQLDAGGAQALEAGPVALEALEDSRFNWPNLGSELVDEIAVVTDEQQCALERLENGFQLLASEKIEMVRRLVQYEKIRVPCGESGESQSTSLSAAQHADALEHVLSFEEESGEMVASFGVGHSARELHRVEHGVVTGQLELSLCQKREARGRGRLHVALERGEIANEGAHERGLSRPVRTDDRDPGITPDSQHPGTEERLAVADRERRRLHDRVARQVRCLKLPSVLLRALWFGGDVNSTLKAVRGGTQQISKAIAEAIDPERLMLECKVESVAASGGGVKVRYRRGEGEPEEVEASICISAMTADAVLEAIPDLPEAKREALQSVLPYAPVVTVAWLTDEPGPMPWDRLLAVPAIDLSFELLSNNAFFVRRDSATRRKGGSLVTLATGPRAEALLALTDEAIVARVRADLLKMFPSERDVLERATTRVERWRGLPRFGKGWLGRQKVLREPFGRIHFCGDYTAQPGTPGAVGSGYHAAGTVRALLG